MKLGALLYDCRQNKPKSTLPKEIEVPIGDKANLEIELLILARKKNDISARFTVTPSHG